MNKETDSLSHPKFRKDDLAPLHHGKPHLSWSVRTAADPHDLTLEIYPRQAIKGLTLELGPAVESTDDVFL